MDKNLELVIRYRNGDESAFDELLNNHRKMIYGVIYSLDLNLGDFKVDEESLFQEGSLALLKCVNSFEENKGTKFSSFAFLSIRSRIATIYRNNYKYYKHESYSIDADDKDVDYHISMANMCVCEDPVMYHKELEFSDKLNKFLDNLSSVDQKILAYRQDDYSYKEVSKALGLSPKQVDNRIASIKRKLRKFLKNNE